MLQIKEYIGLGTLILNKYKDILFLRTGIQRTLFIIYTLIASEKFMVNHLMNSKSVLLFK
jgi:hypothetical protein